MKENKNGQTIQGNLTDKKGKEGTEANPKREGNTPEKITPIENKKIEQTGDLTKKRGTESPDKSKTPVAEENNNIVNGNTVLNTPKSDLNEGSNGNEPDSRREDTRSKKSKTPVLDREDEDLDDDGELEENDDLEHNKMPVAERDEDEDEDEGEREDEELEMPISYSKK